MVDTGVTPRSVEVGLLDAMSAQPGKSADNGVWSSGRALLVFGTGSKREPEGRGDGVDGGSEKMMDR